MFCAVYFSSLTVTIIIVLVFFLLLLVLFLTFSCYREAILIRLYSNECTRFLFSDEIIDSDKPYDVFISYAHQDADYVHEESNTTVNYSSVFTYRLKIIALYRESRFEVFF